MARSGILLGTLLAVHGAIVVAAQPSNGTPSGTASYSGSSFIIPKPAPDSSFRRLAELNVTFYGPDILNRTVMETAFQATESAIKSFFGITIEIRWTYYTAHPFLTPGLENFTAIIQHTDIYGGPDVDVGLILSLGASDGLVLLGAQVTLSAASQGIKLTVISNCMEVLYLPGTPPKIAKSAVDGHTVVLTRMEVRGYNLLPFHFDKQTVLLDTLFPALLAGGVPLAGLNISDWSIAEAATTGNRRLLVEPVDVLHVDIWTTVYPWGALTPELLWSNISSPDPRVWESTGKYGAAMNISFLNATAYSWPENGKANITTTSGENLTETVDQGIVTESIANTTSSASGLGTGVIAGITLGSAVLLVGLAGAVLVTLLLLRRRAGRQAAMESKVDYLGQINPDEIVICKRPDGNPWLLGEGSFGKVYKAIRRGTSVVAVKKFSCTADEEVLREMKKESAILKRVANDPHIVQFYGTCLCNPPMLCMEYMEGGDLHSALMKDGRIGSNRFGWYNKGKVVALEVARGLHFLHTSGVIHRDVKCSNILLTKHGDAKVADVGLAAMPDYMSSFKDTFGTFAYAAPEVLLGDTCTDKMDVYSYGIMLWELVTKTRPQRGKLRKIRVPEECPSEVEALFFDCIVANVDARPNMREVIARLEKLGCAS